MAPTGSAYRTDWVWSKLSNVHTANHRDWFTTFTELKSHICDFYSGGEPVAEVHGIGDVQLNVKVREGRTGSKSRRTIVLEDVLYTPSLPCNILGSPILRQYRVETTNPDSQRHELFDKTTGEPAGILDDVKLLRLRLIGLNATESSLQPSQFYRLNAIWSNLERTKWLLQPNDDSQGLHSLSKLEKTWLKEHYGSEWKFLTAFGLNLTKDEDRITGRHLLKQFILMERGPGEEKTCGGSDPNNSNFLAELKEGPASHVADHYFSAKELLWVEKSYRNTGTFMRMMGLRPWDDEHCKMAVQIARRAQKQR